MIRLPFIFLTMDVMPAILELFLSRMLAKRSKFIMKVHQAAQEQILLELVIKVKITEEKHSEKIIVS